MWSGEGEMLCAITGDQGDRPWALSKLAFVCNGVVGRLIGDTGASLMLVSKSFVERTKLVVEEMEINTQTEAGDVIEGAKPEIRDLPDIDVDALKKTIWDKIPVVLRGDPAAAHLVNELLKRSKLFGEVNTKDLTEQVEFRLKPGA